MDHAGAGDTHVDDGLRLTYPVEGAGHEGVILHGVAEHHQLGAAEAALVGGALGGSLHRLAHELDGIHIDARPVEPTFTEEHTSSVVARASGMERISFTSDSVIPFWTRAE